MKMIKIMLKELAHICVSREFKVTIIMIEINSNIILAFSR